MELVYLCGFVISVDVLVLVWDELPVLKGGLSQYSSGSGIILSVEVHNIVCGGSGAQIRR